jgi:hypothetical protein
MTHLLSIIVLLLKITGTKSCRGEVLTSGNSNAACWCLLRTAGVQHFLLASVCRCFSTDTRAVCSGLHHTLLGLVDQLRQCVSGGRGAGQGIDSSSRGGTAQLGLLAKHYLLFCTVCSAVLLPSCCSWRSQQGCCVVLSCPAAHAAFVSLS